MSVTDDNLTSQQTIDDEEPLDVLDLPQLYQRPPAADLLSVLNDLSYALPSWSGTTKQPRRKIKNEGVPAYLTKIIGSPLSWIEEDAVKEQIWEEAAQRLSERSGRTGMGDITRVFEIPLSSTAIDSESTTDALRLSIHEPALSEDSLGLKTWAASYLLAKRLSLLKSTLLTPTKILELGAGTGLVGFAAAAIFQCLVLQTDLPAIVPNLTRNAESNATSITARGGSVRTAILDWSNPARIIFADQDAESSADEDSNLAAQTFPLILAADPIYSSSHPALLVQAIAYHLARTVDARVVIELPLRDAFVAERRDLRELMGGVGLRLLDEGEEVGFDDWMDGRGDDLVEVRCWWGVWGWGLGENEL